MGDMALHGGPAVGRHALHERVKFGGGDRRAGRVVRVADEDQAGACSDRSGHCGQIVTLVGGERDRNGSGPGHLNQDRVSLEGTPGENHFIAGTGTRVNQLGGHLDRAGAESQVGGLHVESLGDARGDLGRSHARVEVDVPERLGDAHHDRRQRRKRVLVAGEFECAGIAGRDALLIGGKLADRLALVNHLCDLCL